MISFRVVFVCRGNICRSPMAEAAFTYAVERAGLNGQIAVSSAGISSWHVGESPDPRAAEVIRQHGYSTVEGSAALKISAEHRDAQLVIALDRPTYEYLTAKGFDRSRVRMIGEFGEWDGRLSVADPYHGTLADFESAMRSIESAIPEILRFAVKNAQ